MCHNLASRIYRQPYVTYYLHSSNSIAWGGRFSSPVTVLRQTAGRLAGHLRRQIEWERVRCSAFFFNCMALPAQVGMRLVAIPQVASPFRIRLFAGN